MGSMWSEAFPACKWFNSPTLLLPSLNGIGQTLPLCLCYASLNPGKRSSVWSSAYVAPLEGVKPSTCAPRDSTQSGRNYRLSEPEVNAVHLCQSEGLQCGLLPDLSLHAVSDVSGPDHLEAQGLAPRRRDERAPQVDALPDELRGDHRPGRQRRGGSWKHTEELSSVNKLDFIRCHIDTLDWGPTKQVI